MPELEAGFGDFRNSCIFFSTLLWACVNILQKVLTQPDWIVIWKFQELPRFQFSQPLHCLIKIIVQMIGLLKHCGEAWTHLKIINPYYFWYHFLPWDLIIPAFYSWGLCICFKILIHFFLCIIFHAMTELCVRYSWAHVWKCFVVYIISFTNIVIWSIIDIIFLASRPSHCQKAWLPGSTDHPVPENNTLNNYDIKNHQLFSKSLPCIF